MTKDATVSVRIPADVKTDAEDILQRLGIPVSVVINSLYRQIVYTNGIPFALTLPAAPKTLDAMTREELDRKLEHSYRQSLAGQRQNAKDFFDSLERGLSDGAV